MESKPVSESVTIISMVMLPNDANTMGNVHGGVIMKAIDNAGGVAAKRHARANVVTASIDRLDFHNPCYVADVLTLRASVNYAGKTSMEVGVRAEAEDIISGEVRHIASAYLTFVSLDRERKPRAVPGIEPESELETKRYREAEERRRKRLEDRNKERK